MTVFCLSAVNDTQTVDTNSQNDEVRDLPRKDEKVRYAIYLHFPTFCYVLQKKTKFYKIFFSRPSPKAGRELQTELYRIMDDGGREGPLAEPVTGL